MQFKLSEREPMPGEKLRSAELVQNAEEKSNVDWKFCQNFVVGNHTTHNIAFLSPTGQRLRNNIENVDN